MARAKKKTNDTVKKKNSNASWRSIRQAPGKTVVSKVARKKRFWARAKVLAAIMIVLAVLTGAGFGVLYLKNNPVDMRIGSKPHPLRDVEFVTDGVLTKEWLLDKLGYGPTTDLMQIDLFTVKERLESIGQVASAVVTKRFPDVLEVTIRERSPLLRALMMRDQQREIMVIARDGVLYRPVNYSRKTLAGLPFIGGVKFQKNERGQSFLAGAEPLYELITLARTKYPTIYADWRVIHCDRYDPRPGAPYSVIEVQGRTIDRIIFAPESISNQLAELEQVLYQSKLDNRVNIHKVDLSLDEQVIVQTETSGSERGVMRN